MDTRAFEFPPGTPQGDAMRAVLRDVEQEGLTISPPRHPGEWTRMTPQGTVLVPVARIVTPDLDELRRKQIDQRSRAEYEARLEDARLATEP